MSLTLLIARHGQTDLNIHECWQGSTDAPLNATGWGQAQALAQALAGQRLDALISSPLLRARQTAQAVLDARPGLPFALEERLRERDFGVFEGLNPEQARQQHPQQDAARLIYQWSAPLPGGQGETTQAVVQRVAQALAELRQRHAGQTVLLVCHGFVIRCLRHLIDDVPPDAFFELPRLENGGWLRRYVD